MIESKCTTTPSSAPRLSMAKHLFRHSVHRRAGIFDIRHSDLIRHSGFGILILSVAPLHFQT